MASSRWGLIPRIEYVVCSALGMAERQATGCDKKPPGNLILYRQQAFGRKAGSTATSLEPRCAAINTACVPRSPAGWNPRKTHIYPVLPLTHKSEQIKYVLNGRGRNSVSVVSVKSIPRPDIYLIYVSWDVVKVAGVL